MMQFSLSRVGFTLFLLASTLAEKQIKLEDIEKDNLKAAEQAKLEKHFQKYGFQNVQYQYQPQQQQQQYTQSPQYQQQGQQYSATREPSYTQEEAVSFQQPSVTYQTAAARPPSAGHSHYSPYVLPFNPAHLLSMIQGGNYATVPSNSLESTPSQHSAPQQAAYLQQYYSQQLQPVSPSAAQSMAPSQPQPVVMSFSSPSLAAFQQQAQAYYQGLQSQIPQLIRHASQQSGQQYPQFLYQPQLEAVLGGSATPSTSQSSTPLAYTQQQFVPQFQMLKYPTASLPAASVPQFNPSAYRNFVFPSQFMTSQAYTQTEEPPLQSSSLKSSGSLSQQHQYYQSLATTASPLQKYNSPQYLAQNYNTITSSSFPKSTFSKPTYSTAVKVATQGGFLPSNPSTSAIHSQAYRSFSG